MSSPEAEASFLFDTTKDDLMSFGPASCSMSTPKSSSRPRTDRDAPNLHQGELSSLILALKTKEPSFDKLMASLPEFRREMPVWEFTDEIGFLLETRRVPVGMHRDLLAATFRSHELRREVARACATADSFANAVKAVNRLIAGPDYLVQLKGQLYEFAPRPGETYGSLGRRFVRLAQFAHDGLLDPGLIPLFLSRITGTPIEGHLRMAALTSYPDIRAFVTKTALALEPMVVVPLGPPSVTAASTSASLPPPPPHTPGTKISSELREYRLRYGLCLFCGGNGHLNASCPKRLNKNPEKCFIEVGKLPIMDLHIKGKEGDVVVRALLDSGSQPEALISSATARELGAQQLPIANPIRIEGVDGKTSGVITEGVRLSCAELGEFTAGVTPDLAHPIIVGTPLLQCGTTQTGHALPIKILFEAGLEPEEFQRQMRTVRCFTVKANPAGLPVELKEFEDVFNVRSADELPPHRESDLEIKLKDSSSEPPDSRLFRLAEPEMRLLEDYVDSMLQKGFIRPSSSSSAAGVFFVKKKDGGLRLCVDYRELNAITVKNRFPIPLIDQILDSLGEKINKHEIKVFSKIDLKNGYHLLRMKSGSEHLTAFKTPVGLFEYQVVPFGLCNAPAAFSSWIHSIFADLIGKSLISYLDDIILFSRSKEEHTELLKEVLQRMRTHRLVANPAKCEFFVQKTDFLGFTIATDGIEMSQDKRNSIGNWKFPRTRRGLQRFIGFVNFYRRFIAGFSASLQPLLNLASLKGEFNPTDSDLKAFEEIKRKFLSDVTLSWPDSSKRFVVIGDSSDFALGFTVYQTADPSEDLNVIRPSLKPVSFFSRKLKTSEMKLDAAEKEALHIVESLRRFRPWFLSSRLPILYFTDHKNHNELTQKRRLPKKLLRWRELIEQFDIVVKFVPGSEIAPEDAISRREEFQWSEEEKERILSQSILPQSALSSSATVTAASSDLIRRILEENPDQSEHDVLVVNSPELRKEILELTHNNKISGHPGIRRTLARITPRFTWPRLREEVREWVRSCSTCQRQKVPRTRPVGTLLPLKVAEAPWSSISMDWVTGLPNSKGYNAILVVCDRFTKLVHLIPTVKSYTASRTAQQFIESVWKYHGLPKEIISDRDKVFLSHFWDALCGDLGIKLCLSSARHPESDGQSERSIQTVMCLIRSCSNFLGDDWAQHLPFVEMAFNSSRSEATGLSPMEASFGFTPNFDGLRDSKITLSRSVDASKELLIKIRETFAQISKQLHLTQERMKRFADKLRTNAPEYRIGDLVFLDRRQIPSSSENPKMDSPFIGPFPIVKKINPVSMKLRLPSTMRIHPVFHVSLLKPCVGQHNPSENLTISERNSLTPSLLLRSRTSYGKTQFLVRWEGLGEADDSWVPQNSLPSHLVKQFLCQRESLTKPDTPEPDTSQPEYWEQIYRKQLSDSFSTLFVSSPTEKRTTDTPIQETSTERGTAETPIQETPIQEASTGISTQKRPILVLPSEEGSVSRPRRSERLRVKFLGS